VQRDRPLDRILVAYHAFANMLLFYRTVLRSGLADDPYCVEMETRLSRELEHLERPLRGNPALTPTGVDLSEPLMEQLRAST
jgi:HEXXH motif-containing protein